MTAAIYVAAVLFCIYALVRILSSPTGSLSQSSKSRWLNVLFIYSLSVYVLPGIFTPLWERSNLAALLSLSITTAILGVIWQYKQSKHINFVSTIVGAFSGSQLGLLYHLILSYTVLDNFEDMNMGFHVTYMFHSLFTLIVGFVIGFLVWFAASAPAAIKKTFYPKRNESDI